MLLRCCLLLAITLPVVAFAQTDGSIDHAPPRRDSVSIMATGIVTRVAPAIAGNVRTEALVTQPMIVVRGSRLGGALLFAGMLNAERWTMPGGEPVAGIWGEGFIDRRHPHTVVHEVMLTTMRRMRSAAVSVSAGRGIVPFGTDDPMVRPFTKYPANHHFTQVLERVQLVSAARIGTHLGAEVAAFNGDEPASPTAAPRWRRFGDSRAFRLSAWPVAALEVQGSAASLQSPEFADGQGLDQRKWSASARWTRPAGRLRYLLAEWARTEERYAGRSIVDYGSGLAEALAEVRNVRVALRLERTSRPEEERLLDPFRTSRPPTGFTILGITRWHLLSGHVARPIPRLMRVHGSLFTEATYARSTPLLRPVLLDPANVSGGRDAWHVTAGLRIGVGAMPARVGRYGAAAGRAPTDVSLTMPHDH